MNPTAKETTMLAPLTEGHRLYIPKVARCGSHGWATVTAPTMNGRTEIRYDNGVTETLVDSE